MKKISPPKTTILSLLSLSTILFTGCGGNEIPETSIKSSAEQILKVDPSRPLLIQSEDHQISNFDRNKYFRTYHFPGLYSAEQNAELHRLGALPGRGTGPQFRFPGNPLTEPATAARIAQSLERWRGFSKVAMRDFPGLDYGMAGHGMPQGWWPTEATGGDDVDTTMQIASTFAVAPEYYEAAAGLIIEWLRGIDAVQGLAPLYYSAVNEPDAAWRIRGDRVGTFISYHRAIAEILQKEVPNLKITGPCTAWGFPTANFSRWQSGWEGRFIDEAGDTVDAYDFHFYSKGYWAFIEGDAGWDPRRQQDHPSLYASRRTGVGTIWEFGRLEAFLDMVASRHLLRWGGTPPSVIVTEFGRQGISKQLGPWENDFKSLLYMNTVLRMWMTFFQRPEIKLTVPFILPQSDLGYGSQRGQAMYTRPGYPEDKSLVATPFVPFYEFFSELNGERVASYWEAEEIGNNMQYLALRNGSQLYVLVHNPKPFGTKTPTAIRLTEEAELIASHSIRWEGPIPERVDHDPEGRLIIGETDMPITTHGKLTEFDIHGEETILLRWNLPSQAPMQSPLRQSWIYTPIELEELNPGERLTLEIPEAIKSANGKVELRIGVASARGFSGNLIVAHGVDNSQLTTLDLSFSSGIEAYHDTVSVSFSKVEGDFLRLSLEEGGFISSAKWVITE